MLFALVILTVLVALVYVPTLIGEIVAMADAWARSAPVARNEQYPTETSPDEHTARGPPPSTADGERGTEGAE